MSWSIRVNFDQGYRTNRIKSNWTSQKSPLRRFISFRRQRATKWPLFFRSIKWSAPSSNPTKIHDASADYYFIFFFLFFFGFHKIERRRRQGRTNCGPRQLLPVVNCCSDRTQVKQHTDRWHGSAVYTTAPSAASQQKQTTTDNTRIYRL